MRAKGVAFFQLFSRSAGFFNNYVNPIGLARIGWKYYISYCCLLCVEIVFVYFLFPETSGKTLEELAFRGSSPYRRLQWVQMLTLVLVFEPEEMQAQKDRAVARALKNKDTEGEVTHIESINDGAKMAGDTERVGSGEKSPPTYTAVTKD